jgi:AcrR family transcriptional regulator
MLPYDEKLDRLLGIAADVFASKGYHPTTMRDLARATGMSLAGMYHYVRGKDELLYLIQERCFTRVLEGAAAAMEENGSPIERLRRFIRHHVTFFAAHMSEMKVLSHEALCLSDERISGINTLKRRYVAILTDLVRKVTHQSDANATVDAYALFGMMNWIYNWYDPHGIVGPEALADQFANIYVHGLTASSPASVSQGG